MENQIPEHAEPPGCTRYKVGLWLCGLSGVLYLDRICMAQALVPIQKDLGLNNSMMAMVGVAFTVAYGLFEIPAGRWGDRFGSRFVLVRIVMWWSLFTILTGVCSGFYSLLFVRFMFGAGEAGAFPNAARVIGRWFPQGERGRAQAFMLAAAQAGGVVAPAATAWLIELMGWRASFMLFGLVGVAWAFGFWRWFRDDPAGHPGVGKGELELIRSGVTTSVDLPKGESIPWAYVMVNRGILTLCMLMICGAFFTYLVYVWFPKYLQDARGLDNVSAGYWTSLVILGSAVGMVAGGWLGDYFSNSGADLVNGCRKLGAGCYLVAALSITFGTFSDNNFLFCLLWALAFFAFHVTLPNWWLLAMRQGGKHVGSLSGLMNGVGCFGAILSQLFVGWFTDARKAAGFQGRDQWDPMFFIYAGVLVFGALVWWSHRFTPLAERGGQAGPRSPSNE